MKSIVSRSKNAGSSRGQLKSRNSQINILSQNGEIDVFQSTRSKDGAKVEIFQSPEQMVHRIPKHYSNYRPSQSYNKAKTDSRLKNRPNFVENQDEISSQYFRETYDKYINKKKPYNNMKELVNHHYLTNQMMYPKDPNEIQEENTFDQESGVVSKRSEKGKSQSQTKFVPWEFRRNPISGMCYTQKIRTDSRGDYQTNDDF